MLEETGLEVEVGPVIEVFDRIMHDDEGRVQYHYVLVDYLCWPVGGTLAAGLRRGGRRVGRARGARRSYRLTDKATAVIGAGIALAAERRGGRRTSRTIGLRRHVRGF